MAVARRVNLQPVVTENFEECLALDVAPAQRDFVAANVKSLAEAYVDPTLTPLAVYDYEALGHLPPQIDTPMRGFVMYEIKGGVGFILRVMVDVRFQGQGYGRAAVVEVIDRLRQHPEVQLIATSHRAENEASAALFRSLGFIAWDISWAAQHEGEVYLVLPPGDRARWTAR